ncbi:MAG TPA: PepSY-like domain-containing protein [Sediminibacterium sp.]|nr:PepSY-like domain-containing protein [Sediminibacterium sp.]
MKKFATLLCLLLIAGWASAKEVNETVLKAFRKSFPSANQVSWSEEANRYLVFFKRNEVSFRLVYDKDGALLTAYKYYGADDLPPFILNKLKTSYPGYSVHGITEVSDNNSLEYHISLETDSKILNLRSDPIGNLDVESRYNKAD